MEAIRAALLVAIVAIATATASSQLIHHQTHMIQSAAQNPHLTNQPLRQEDNQLLLDRHLANQNQNQNHHQNHHLPQNHQDEYEHQDHHLAHEAHQRQQAHGHHLLQHNQHQTQADNMQQVLLDNSRQQYHFAHTQFAWRHESNQDGELSEIFVQNYEYSLPMSTQDQISFYQYQQLQQHQHHQQQHQYLQYHHHAMYSRQVDHDIEHDLNTQNNHQPDGYCNSHNPSILMESNLQGPTCKASSAHLDNSEGAHSNQRNVPNFSQLTNKASQNSNIDSYPLAHHHYNYESSLMGAIRHYWREVSGLCLASAIFLNWLFVVVKRRFTLAADSTRSKLNSTSESIQTQQLHPTQQANIMPLPQAAVPPSSSTTATIASTTTATTTKSLSKDTNSSAHDSAFEENPTPIHLDDIDSSSSSTSSIRDRSAPILPTVQTPQVPVMRQRSSTLRAKPISIPVKQGHNSLSTSLSNSLNSSEYNSRYSSDFDSIQRLGRGGFGIVFEARNKIDDCHYAVKRICLPLEREARERVMREVRALAKLDHAGIVRYYNAWLESPPDEWLKQHDAQLGIVHSKDGPSFPSTDGIYERNDYEQNTKDANSKDRLEESGDSSDLFGNSPFKRRSNGFRKFLKNNSSSPSLDIVFEGSGSIRLEAENNTGETNSNKKKNERLLKDASDNKHKASNREFINGDNNINSDSEDSDFIQFESRSNKKNEDADDITGGEDNSFSSHLTDPFDSTSSSTNCSIGDGYKRKFQGYPDEDDDDDDDDDEEDEEGDGGEENDSVGHNVDGDQNNTLRCKKSDNSGRSKQIISQQRNALNQQRQSRQSNNNQSTLMTPESHHNEKVYLYIQMQLCRKDTLKDWLKTNCENRDKTTIFDLFYQIVDAVEYVHSQDLIHRDLKPSNIFFSLDGTLKIGDFGLCRTKTSVAIGSSLDLQEYAAESDVERSFEAVHTEQVGTQLYMSPEQLNGLCYNQKVDIFAMGLILLELLIPFKTQMQRVNVLFKARNNLYSDEFRNEFPGEHELVKSLLCRSPQRRPTATEIKQHELLASAHLSQPVIERIYHRRRTISSNSSTE